MYRPKRYIRLNQLPRMPRLADIKTLFEEGKKARSCTVELPWRTEKMGMTFSLTVRVDVGGSEPIWTLYEGEGNRSRVMWSTGFADVDLLYDVLTLSLPTDGPNIFAPVEEVKAQPPAAASSSSEPTYYESEAYKNQSSQFEAAGSFASSPFLKDEDQFMKPDQSFESFSKSGGNNPKDEFKYESNAPQAVPTRNAPLPTAEFVNPLAEPSIALGTSHTASTTSSDALPQSAQPAPLPQNPIKVGNYPDNNFADQFVSSAQPGQVPAGAAHGAPSQPVYSPQPAYSNQYPAGYPAQQGYPPYPVNQQPGYPPYPMPPQGYPGQYPPPGYPPQNYPGIGVSGQYPQAYPPYGYPQGGPQDPMMPAGTVPLGPGMNGPMLDPYGMPMMPQPVVNKRPPALLGNLLVEAGLVPKTTIDSALQVQVLVSQGTLSPVKAAEAVRRAHLRGGAVEPEINPIKQNESVVRIKPQIGQVLVMANIITAVQLKAALYLQDSMRTGSMTMEEAVELLRREANVAQVKSQSADQIKAPQKEDLSKAINLVKQAGLINDSDLEAANNVKAKHGGEIAKILMVAGKLDDLTLDAARTCQSFVDAGKLRVDQAIMALHYCQRMRVPFEEAASELGYEVE